MVDSAEVIRSIANDQSSGFTTDPRRVFTDRISTSSSSTCSSFFSTQRISPSGGSSRVYRGGGWNFISGFTRVAGRNAYDPDIRFYDVGFRLSRTIP